MDARITGRMLFLGLAATALAGCGGPGPAAVTASPTPEVTVSPEPPSPPGGSTPAPTTAPTPPPPTVVPTIAPTPPAPPLPAGTFGATVTAAGADIRSGPGTDFPVVGREPGGVAEVFDGWFRRGDDVPVPDATTGALEVSSQDYLRLSDGRGWIHSSYVRGMQPAGMPPVTIAVAPPRGVATPAAGQRRIVISLLRQHLWAFDGPTLVTDTVVATGRPALPTPAGTYHVFARRSPYRFVSPWPPGSPYWYASAWSTYAMEFIGGGYFIHDAPWRSRWGPGANFADGSHGCVNVPIGPMTTLWSWTRLGEEVVVQAG